LLPKLSSPPLQQRCIRRGGREICRMVEKYSYYFLIRAACSGTAGSSGSTWTIAVETRNRTSMRRTARPRASPPTRDKVPSASRIDIDRALMEIDTRRAGGSRFSFSTLSLSCHHCSQLLIPHLLEREVKFGSIPTREVKQRTRPRSLEPSQDRFKSHAPSRAYSAQPITRSQVPSRVPQLQLGDIRSKPVTEDRSRASSARSHHSVASRDKSSSSREASRERETTSPPPNSNENLAVASHLSPETRRHLAEKGVAPKDFSPRLQEDEEHGGGEADGTASSLGNSGSQSARSWETHGRAASVQKEKKYWTKAEVCT